MEHIAVLDFGSQYSHLISRRIRDLGACAEVFSSTVSLHKLKHTKGIILSGAAYSVYDKRAPALNKKILQLGIPILGICYGHQVIAHSKNGVVAEGESGEYGLTDLVAKKSVLLNGLNKKEKVWMNHMDVVKSLPKNFIITGSTEHSPVAVFENEKENIYGVQFHPEVTHTRKGNTILSNFIFTICNCEKNWNSKTLIDDIVEEAKKTIGDKKAIIGLSGGIDSSVAAALVSQAIGKKLTAVYVDTGLMRTYETEFLKEAFSDVDLTLKIVKAGAEFFRKLKGVTSPERKRKIIGKLFVDIFNREAKKINAEVLIQGTIYSDRIESGATKNASVIKSHHNVGGLPNKMKLKLYEPLRELYKDEVRSLAKELQLSTELRTRQVFPGPGLAIRMLGEVTKKKADIVRKASFIVEHELKKAKLYDQVWMSFAVLLPIKSVGIQGDKRSYKYPIVVRIISSEDAMTAHFSKIPFDVLEKISTRITNEVQGVNRVVYDISNKPPATMEWE